MSKKWRFNLSDITRRDFIKKKILGGIIYAAGFPFLSFGNEFKAGKPPLKLRGSFKNYDQIDWDSIRSQFTMNYTQYYFNAASLGPSPQVVVDEICETLEYLETKAGLRSSDGHTSDFAPHLKIAKFLNTNLDNIAITRNTTEGMNIVARGLPLRSGDEILLTKHEHIGGAAPWIALKNEIGLSIKLIDLDLTGNNNLQIIKDNITEKTKVVSISHITCTTGMCLPIKEIVALCRQNGIYSCIDGAQAIGMIPIDLTAINPDFYVCGGHKWLLGPKGTGILFINDLMLEKHTPTFVGSYSDSKYDLDSLILEYGKSARREEYGTRSMPLISGLSSAIDFISTIGIENIADRGRELANHFRACISDTPEIEVLTPRDPEFSASIVTIRIRNMDNLEIAHKLFEKEERLRVRGIYECNLNGIRVSFGIYNSFKEIDYLSGALKQMIDN